MQHLEQKGFNPLLGHTIAFLNDNYINTKISLGIQAAIVFSRARRARPWKVLLTLLANGFN